MKRIFLALLLASTMISIQAQTMKDVFTSIPELGLLPLSTNDRLDLLDLYLNDKEAVVKNAFGDEVFLTHLTDDYLNIQSGNSTTEIFILTLINESKLIGLIQTVCSPACDSHLAFYSINWKNLDPEAFISPGLSDSFLEFHCDSEKQLLLQTDNIPAYLNFEDEIDREKKPEETKEYKWNGLRFQ
jgi:hypothetical protein